MQKNGETQFLEAFFGIASGCRQYSDLIFDYAEQERGMGYGDLTVQQMDEIKDHLAQCPVCHAEYIEVVDDIENGPTEEESAFIRKAIFRADVNAAIKGRVKEIKKHTKYAFEMLSMNIRIGMQPPLVATRSLAALGGGALGGISVSGVAATVAGGITSILFNKRICDTNSGLKKDLIGNDLGSYEIKRNDSEGKRTFLIQMTFGSRGQAVVIWRNPDDDCLILSPHKDKHPMIKWDDNVLEIEGVIPEDELLGDHMIFVTVLPEDTIEDIELSFDDVLGHTQKASELINKLPETSEKHILKIEVTE